MAKQKIEVQASIGSLLQFYKEERRLYARCPHCDEAFRLSETKITYGKEPPRDLLTQLKRERDALNEQIDELEDSMAEAEERHEADLADNDAEWEMKQEVRVEKEIQKKIKEIRQQAIARSRVTTLGKAIERIAPVFSGFGHHPGDVRPLFEPIDFVVFSGLYGGTVSDVVFIEFKTGNATLSKVQKSIRSAVDRGRITFEERRMNATTLKQLVTARNEGKGGRPLLELGRRRT